MKCHPGGLHCIPGPPGGYIDPRWSTSSSFRFSLGQVTAGGRSDSIHWGKPQRISMCPKFLNEMVDSSISLGVNLGQKVDPTWLLSKTLPCATLFFANMGRLSVSETVNPINKGEASQFREDKIDVFASERKRSLSETPSPTCRACFRYALTRTPAEEPKKISIDSPVSPSHVFYLRAILGARKAGTVSNVGVSLERDKMTEPNATILDHELYVCHPRSSA